MADYYVIYQGTTYEVADFAAGIAKAQELGPDAVFYVEAPTSTAGHTYAQGVTTVFLGGNGSDAKKYIFGGSNGATQPASTNVTIADGTYNYVFGGGYSGSAAVIIGSTELNIVGGSMAYAFAGSWGAADSVVTTGTINVTGGALTYLDMSGYTGTVTNAVANISGGWVKACRVIDGASGGNIHVGTATINISGGTVGNKNFAPDAAKKLSSVDAVVLNLTGGYCAGSILGTGSTVVEGTTIGTVTVNIDGFLHSGIVAGGYTQVATDGMTVNLISGSVGTLYAGTYGASSQTQTITCPLTVNVTGGSVKTIYGGGNSNTTVNSNIAINISGGHILPGGVYGGSNAATCSQTGNSTVTITGGTIETNVYGGGNSANQTGDTAIIFSDGLLKGHLYAGVREGTLTGNASVTVTGGTVGSASYWILGSNGGSISGKLTITVDHAAAHHIFAGAGNVAGAALGGTEVVVTDSFITGAIQGGGYRGNVEGGAKVTVTGGTLARGEFHTYSTEAWIVGGAAHADAEVLGGITVDVDNVIINGSVVGGSRGGYAEGAVSLTLKDVLLGLVVESTDPETQETHEWVYGGDVFVAGGVVEQVGNATASLTNVSALGGLYVVQGGSTVTGDTAITVANAMFCDGIYLEKGRWDETTDPDTGETTITEYYTTEIDGNVAISLSNVIVEGDVWGKGRNYDLASFTQGKGITLAVAGEFTVTGEVAYFDRISLAAGATIAAGTTTASAITAEAAAADGLYTLATGFAAQASVISITSAGVALGSVTLSDAITSGSFTAGNDTYNVGIADDVLYLGKNTAIPEPTPPTPPTPAATGAEVILTITDPNHDYFGATGGWKVQADQTVAWQDLTTLGEGYSYLGLGVTAAGKAMPDIFVYNAGAAYIAAYTTDDTGAITGFETAFLGSGALSQVGLADFNADGVSDLLLRTADGFVGTYADGVFSEVQGLGLEWTVAALGDVDGNGRADVIIAHEAGYVGAYLIGADGSISWADLGNVDETTAIVGAGDVNGDGTDDVIVQVGSNYYGAWLCGAGAVTGFFGIGTFDAEVQDIADYNGDGTSDLLLRTASGVVGAALITGADTTTWAEYGALGAEWSTKGVGIL